MTGAGEPQSLESMSPAETGRALEELRIHQIELQMQNEELHRAQAELDAARARYFDLYDLAPVGYVTVSEKGLILEANLTAARLLGVERSALVKRRLTSFILPQDEDLYYLQRKQLLETDVPQVCEVRMMRSDSAPFWVRVELGKTANAEGAQVFRVVISDITERKRAEQEREVTIAFLRLVNRSTGTREILHAATTFFQEQSGCEAAGIRVREGDDYPYFEARGFPQEFVWWRTSFVPGTTPASFSGTARESGSGVHVRERDLRAV